MRLRPISITICLFGLCACAAPEDSITRARELFEEGDSKTISVMVPKEHFAGAPWRPSGYPRGNRPPSYPGDFEEKVFVVRIESVDPMEGGAEVVLSMPEIEPFTGIPAEEPDWWGYMKITPDAVNMDGGDRERWNLGLNVVRGSLPFVLSLSLPPTLIPRQPKKWERLLGDCIILHTFETSPDQRKTVTATYAEDTHNLLPHQWREYKIEYYDQHTKTFKDAPDARTSPKHIRIREIQTWSAQPDWLWESMERYDQDGNLTMKCRIVASGEQGTKRGQP